jgi:hypothetical protein
MSEATTATDFAKIHAGAAMYLEVLRDRPGKTDDFLAGLRCRLGWSPDEVIALQLRVADILLEVQQAAVGANLTPQELREWLVAVGKELESKAAV